jgi:hypothetical protein
LPKSKLSARVRAIANGYRSGLEEKISQQLESASIQFTYEKHKLNWTDPAKLRKYTPDFVISSNGIIVESKGRFLTADRQKHKVIKAQYPELDIRFVFSNENTRISKQSPTTYAKWCESNGFLYASKLIPVDWLNEEPTQERLEANLKILGWKPEE